MPFMPIILVTAKADSKDVVEGLNAGADEYLTKPVDQMSLVARVKSVLRIKELHDTVTAQAADLASWNKTLEQRVADQITEIERVGRLKTISGAASGRARFFRPAATKKFWKVIAATSASCFAICAASRPSRKTPSLKR